MFESRTVEWTRHGLAHTIRGCSRPIGSMRQGFRIAPDEAPRDCCGGDADEMTMITPATELARHFDGHFRVLILDNEVTVDAFVTDPPLPWARLTASDGVYRIGKGYPTPLTAAEANREELNWDRVSEVAIREALSGLDETIDLVAFGNNAGQGLPLADALPAPLRGMRGVIVYGSSLPERPAYEAAGYGRFCPRSDLVAHLNEAAKATGRPPALGFINTIEHNEQNYHTPWRGRETGER